MYVIIIYLKEENKIINSQFIVDRDDNVSNSETIILFPPSKGICKSISCKSGNRELLFVFFSRSKRGLYCSLSGIIILLSSTTVILMLYSLHSSLRCQYSRFPPAYEWHSDAVFPSILLRVRRAWHMKLLAKAKKETFISSFFSRIDWDIPFRLLLLMNYIQW